MEDDSLLMKFVNFCFDHWWFGQIIVPAVVSVITVQTTLWLFRLAKALKGL